MAGKKKASTAESIWILKWQILRSWTSLGLTSPWMWCHPVGLDTGSVALSLDGWLRLCFSGCFRHSPAPQRHDPRNEILQALDAYELGDPGGTELTGLISGIS